MIPQLHVEKIYNMRISDSDALLLHKALHYALRYATKASLTDTEHERIDAIYTQLGQLTSNEE